MCAADGYRELAEVLGYADSARFRRLLEHLMTEEQARLVVSLPAPPEELAQKLNTDVETVQKLSRDLYEKGVIVPRDFETLEGMRFIRSMVFLHDRMLAVRGLESAVPGISDLWEEFMETEFFPDMAQENAKAERPHERVLPYYKTILDSPELLPYEDVREILKAARVISVVSCACRARTRSCHKIVTDVCMQFDRSAEYGIALGTGKKLSYEEALAVVDAAEEAGLVHGWANLARLTGATMCSCCSCCCIIGRPYLSYNVPIAKRWAKSRYEARVDESLCDGCRGESSPLCIAASPEYFRGCIRMQGTPRTSDFKARVNPELCWGCGACVLKCPMKAITMKLVRPAEHIPMPQK